MVTYSLKGKVALVTGAAYGIGFAMAEALAEAGAKIAFNCRSEEHLQRALDEYKAKGIDAKGYICDVRDEKAVVEMIRNIEQELGAVDILVNNAGIIKRIPMHEMSVEEFSEVVDIDLVAPFIMSKAVIPSMIERGGGKIINICSMMSELGRETVSAYAAAKGGLKMLTRNIASEYGAYNIQCNAIGPGYIATPQTAPLREPDKDGLRSWISNVKSKSTSTVDLAGHFLKSDEYLAKKQVLNELVEVGLGKIKLFPRRGDRSSAFQRLCDYGEIAVLNRDGSTSLAPNAEHLRQIWLQVDSASHMNGAMHLDLKITPQAVIPAHDLGAPNAAKE
jgi:gluconate 5-dehydrogenase